MRPPSWGIPCSAGLIINDVPGAPGFWGLVMIVRREVPAVRQGCFGQGKLIVTGQHNLQPADFLDDALQTLTNGRKATYQKGR